MTKYYKVRLFDGKVVAGNKDYEFIGNIIVKKSNLGYFDVLTGYKVDVVKIGSLKASEVNVSKVTKLGHYPFISLEDVVQKNLATPDDIDTYVDGYEDSKWKNIYEEMKFFTIADKVVITERIKKIYKSKKK